MTCFVLGAMIIGSTGSLAQARDPMPYADYREAVLAFETEFASGPQPSGFPTVQDMVDGLDRSLGLAEAELARLRAIVPEDCYADAHVEYLALFETTLDTFEGIRPQLEGAETVFDVLPFALAWDAEMRSRHPTAYVRDPTTQSGFRLSRINVLDTLGSDCPGAPPPPSPTPSMGPGLVPTAGPTEGPPDEAGEPAPVVVEQHGFSVTDDGSMPLGAVIANPNDSRWAATDLPYRVTVTDAAGGVLSTSEGTIHLLLPGQRTAIGGTASGMVEAVTLEVRVGTPTWRDVGDLTGAFEVTDVRTRTDGFSTTTTGRIAQRLPVPVDEVEVVAIYLRDGEIVGGANGRTSFLDPSAAEPFQIDAYDIPEDIDETRVYGRFGYGAAELLPK